MSILGENLAVFCPWLVTMSEAKFKINRLSNLVGKNVRLHSGCDVVTAHCSCSDL